MDEYATRKMSTSMRNAITTNNYHGHALGKTVKQLEIEKDLKMLSLQMKKDEVIFSSPSSPRGRKTPLQALENNEDLSELTENLKMDSTRKQSNSRRPLLPLIRSNSAKTRRVGMTSPHSLSSQSSPPSPKTHVKLFNSSSVELNVNRETKPMPNERDVLQRVGSPRLSRSSTASPILTAKLPKPESPSSPKSVHRGLAIRPLSWKSATTQKTPQNGEKSKTVFSRLYQVQNVKPKKSIAELMEGAPASPRLRRRSISMPDLSEAMEDLRNCRYLRQNSNDEK